jgi:heme-degrading monooxygenase HmoA
MVRTVAAAPVAGGGRAIQLHVELDVVPGREAEMQKNFHSIFHEAIRRQPGFVEVKLLRLRKPLEGPSPAPYRLEISFQSEEDRLKWVASAAHQQAWPSIGKTLRKEPGIVVLYDNA